MRKLRACTGFCLLLLVSGCSHLSYHSRSIYQISAVQALLDAVYDGETTCGELIRHGDLGIGTFNGLDGEMVLLDGKMYRVRADGKVSAVARSCRTPFAMAMFFRPDMRTGMTEKRSLAALTDALDQFLPSQNYFYAFRIEGFFRHVRTRSVPAQRCPYPPLSEVVKTQPVFDFHGVRGTLVGFRCPDFVSGINMPGYHMHFITEARNGGGHVLECDIERVLVETSRSGRLFLVLPETAEFRVLDLKRDHGDELRGVER